MPVCPAGIAKRLVKGDSPRSGRAADGLPAPNALLEEGALGAAPASEFYRMTAGDSLT